MRTWREILGDEAGDSSGRTQKAQNTQNGPVDRGCADFARSAPDRLRVGGSKRPDADGSWDERAAIAEFEGGLSREDAEAVAEACLPPGGHIPLDEAGLPAGPCRRCGCRSFWRLSMTPEARWNCNVCDRRPVAVFTDACTVPAPVGIGAGSF